MISSNYFTSLPKLNYSKHIYHKYSTNLLNSFQYLIGCIKNVLPHEAQKVEIILVQFVGQQYKKIPPLMFFTYFELLKREFD